MTIFTKYIIVYSYLLLVMSTSFVINKYSRHKEVSRNFIHICAGLGWIIYRMFFPATIHPIIISSSFVLLTIVTKKLKISFIERKDSSPGTILFTVSMLAMSLIGYGDFLKFDIFGIAIVCLSCGDAAANIIGSRYGRKKIYKKKSIQGVIACFVASVIAMATLKYLFDIRISFVLIFLLAVICAVTELFSGDYDNIAIPAIIYTTAYIVITNEDCLHLVFSFVIGVLMFGFARKLKLLNIAASYMLFIFIFVLFYFGGIKSFTVLMLVFSVLIVVEKYFRKRTDSIFQSMDKEYGIRNERQLVANCLVAVVSVAMYGITKNDIYIAGFFTAIAETVGDSMASDVGILSKTNPIDICSLKKVPKGISGGVSIAGTVASLFVCLYTGLLYFCMYEINLYYFFAIVISSFFGIILDSILGSKIQAKYRCVVCKKITEKEYHCQKETMLIKGYKCVDNTKINLICNIFSWTMTYILLK